MTISGILFAEISLWVLFMNLHKMTRNELIAELSKCRKENMTLRSVVDDTHTSKSELLAKEKAISSSISAIVFLDPQLRIKYVNRSFMNLWHYDNEDHVLGKPSSDFLIMHKKKDSILRKLYERGGWIGELNAIRNNGTVFFVEVSATMLTDASESPSDIVMSLIDITRRKEAVEEQKKLVSDLKERVKELNCFYSILKQISGCKGSLEDILYSIVNIIPASWRYPEHASARIVFDKKEYTTQYFRPTKYMQRADFVTSNQIAGYIEVAYPDMEKCSIENPFLKEEELLLEGLAHEIGMIIEHKLSEEEARRNHDKLIHADKMASIGVLASEIIHEINNPNNYIGINTKYLLRAWKSIIPILEAYYQENGEFSVGGLPFDEARKEMYTVLSGILTGTNLIKERVQRLRKFTQKDIVTIDQKIILNTVLESAIHLLYPLIENSTEKFKKHLFQDIVIVKGNRQQLEQVFVHILTNACQALRNRKERIRVISSYDYKNGSICVEISDEGIGICSLDIPKLFDPFYTTKDKSGGTGLGLSISNAIVIRHGGRIEVKSEKNKGTNIKIYLPVA